MAIWERGARTVGRFSAAAGLTVCLTLAGMVPSASAQEWWETFPGFKKQESARPAVNDEQRRQEALSDLRSGSVPLRSQEMIEALEGAIQRYQQIVSNGGWPDIPGSRTVRAEDNDERVSLLHRRLWLSGELRRQPTQTLFGVTYTEDLEGAIRRFQENNGLRVTGRADRATCRR